MKCADLSLGLNGQAWAVAQLLAARDIDFAWDEELKRPLVTIKTFPWYNGRERGFCFVLWKGLATVGPCSLYTVAECRNSTRIFVEFWEQQEAPFNCPTIEERERAIGEDVDDWVYRNRQTFEDGEVGKAANYIMQRMKEWMRS